MARFVTLRGVDGKDHQVNADRVAYVRQRTAGVSLVFDGFPGGVHELVVLGTPAGVVAMLQPPSPAPRPWQATWDALAALQRPVARSKNTKAP